MLLVQFFFILKKKLIDVNDGGGRKLSFSLHSALPALLHFSSFVIIVLRWICWLANLSQTASSREFYFHGM